MILQAVERGRQGRNIAAQAAALLQKQKERDFIANEWQKHLNFQAEEYQKKLDAAEGQRGSLEVRLTKEERDRQIQMKLMLVQMRWSKRDQVMIRHKGMRAHAHTQTRTRTHAQIREKLR